MAELLPRGKALAVNPLKASQTLGAALAFLGMRDCMPMLHGAQGCTAFAKVFLVRHFREPIPLQTSAMDQVAAVMGADDNLKEALDTICARLQPALVGVLTTSLAETEGADVERVLREFRHEFPQHAATAVVPVSAPDYSGSLETGFALALESLIEALVPPAAESATQPGREPLRVNVLAGAQLTPGDLEHLREMVEAFGLEPVLVPDLSASLDGALTDRDFTPLTVGGTPVAELARLGDSAATLVVGDSLHRAADRLHARTGVPDYRLPGLMGLGPVDALMMALTEISGCPVPARLERQRAQLEDAMVDTHFMLSGAPVAMAGEPDLLIAWSALLGSMGADLCGTVATVRSPGLRDLPGTDVKVGDLEDLEDRARRAGARLLVGNSHLAGAAARLELPLLRAGFPVHDQLGAHLRCRIGYRGSRETLFELANLLGTDPAGETRPYRSVFETADRGDRRHGQDPQHARG